MHITICTCRHAQGHVKSFVTRRNVHLFYWLVCTVQQCKQKKIHASKYQSIKWLIPQCSYWFHNDWFHNVHTDSTMFILIPQCSYWFHNVHTDSTMTDSTMFILIPQCSYCFHNVHTDSTMFILIPQCSYWFHNVHTDSLSVQKLAIYLQYHIYNTTWTNVIMRDFPNTTLPLPFLIIKTTTTTKQTNTKTINNTAETFNWNIQTIETSTNQQNTSYPHNKIR